MAESVLMKSLQGPVTSSKLSLSFSFPNDSDLAGQTLSQAIFTPNLIYLLIQQKRVVPFIGGTLVNKAGAAPALLALGH